MVVLKKYYEFVDKPTPEVPIAWKLCHIIWYILTATTGLIVYFIFNSLKQQFGDNCILYPNITFTSNDTYLSQPEIKNVSKSIIDQSTTIWGNEDLCNFCQYVPIMSMIIGTIFLAFFSICPKGGSRNLQTGIKRPWHIVLPALFCSGIFSVIISISSIKTNNGILAFCAEFESELDTITCSENIHQFAFKDTELNTLVFIKLLKDFLVVCTISWIMAFFILLCRCCLNVADFKLMEVTISTIGDDKDVQTEETEVLLEQNPTSSPVSQV